MTSRQQRNLSPLPVRLLSFLAMIVVALGAIWLIDSRAMHRMHEHQQETYGVQEPTAPVESSVAP